MIERSDVKHQVNSRGGSSRGPGRRSFRRSHHDRGREKAEKRPGQLVNRSDAPEITDKTISTPVDPSGSDIAQSLKEKLFTAKTNALPAFLENSVYAINKMNGTEYALDSGDLPFQDSPFGNYLNDWAYETSTVTAFPMCASSRSEVHPDNKGGGGVQLVKQKEKHFTKIATIPAGREIPPEYNAQLESLFFKLPPEIRNKIYKLVFTKYRIQIARRRRLSKKVDNKGACDREMDKKGLFCLQSQHLYPRDATQKISRRRVEKPPLGLFFSCKAVYLETMFHLYSNTQIVLTSVRTVHDFLRKTNPIAKTAIRHIELYHEMYNEPALTQHRIHKERSDYSWYLACQDLSTSLTSLSAVHIHLRICDWPIKLSLDELWAKPVLLFGADGGLDYAEIQLSMDMFRKPNLEEVAKQVEKAIMKPNSFQIKEDMKLALELQGSEGPVKARKALTIVF